jgi:hypothetical protein
MSRKRRHLQYGSKGLVSSFDNEPLTTQLLLFIALRAP